jgi:hypothetical protein
VKPPAPIIFVDRSAGRKLVPDTIKELGGHVELFDDHFHGETEDHVWLTGNSSPWPVLRLRAEAAIVVRWVTAERTFQSTCVALRYSAGRLLWMLSQTRLASI